MQSKFEKFNKLPSELQNATAQKLSNPDLVNLAGASTYHLALFKPVIDVRKLLHHVTREEHDVVNAMLKQDISLIFKRGNVTDCSGREFESISGFEYALWALSKHMWAKMIACVPQNEEGKRIFERLIAQYNKVNTDGVTYRLNGKTVTEQHFDFKNTLIKELQTQVDSINGAIVKKWGDINQQWREGVGGAQKLLPMHIVDEYCSNESFYRVPKFTSQPKSSKQFNNWTTKKDEDWFSVDSKLGSEFAIHKGWAGPGAGRGAARAIGLRNTHLVWDRMLADLEAMTALCKVRTLDLINLRSQLEEQAGLENHYQVAPM